MALFTINKCISLFEKALKPLQIVSRRAIINCTEDGVIIHSEDTNTGYDVALKILKKDFSVFYCNESQYITVDLSQFVVKVTTLELEGESLAVGFHYKPGNDDGYLRLSLHDDKRREPEAEEVPFEDEYQRQLDFGSLGYDVVVGIDSNTFRQRMIILKTFGDEVLVTINEEMVEFQVGDERTFLSSEECVIGGVASGSAVLWFSLTNMSSYMLASELSNSVWLLGSRSAYGLAVLVCPFWPLGNIMYLLSPKGDLICDSDLQISDGGDESDSQQSFDGLDDFIASSDLERSFDGLDDGGV